MINILKLRKLQKGSNMQSEAAEAVNAAEEPKAASTVPVKEKSAAKKEKVQKSKKAKSAEIPAFQEELVEVSVPQDASWENDAAPVIEETAPVQAPAVETVQSDPSEIFRQNLIEQIMRDENMISRADLLKEEEILQAAEEQKIPAVEKTPIAAAPQVKPKEEIKKEEIKPAARDFKKDEIISHEIKNKKALEEIIQLVGFMLGKEYYAVDIMKIKEINRMTDITKVPRAPKFIEGVINLRGNVIPVINLRAKIDMPRREYDKNTRIIIVELKGKTVGFIVDAVREVLRFPTALLSPPPELTVRKGAEYITAVAKLENDLVILMEPDKVLSIEESAELGKK